MSRLAILTYHSIDDSGSVISVAPEVLARHVQVLVEEDYRALTLRAALAERFELGHWPHRTVAVTFDDGFRNVLTTALPMLAQYGFRATVYLVSQHVGRTPGWMQVGARVASLPLLSWSEAAELLAAGWEIGSHTRTHLDLSQSSIVEELHGELVGARDDIQDHLGVGVDSFAYPYGRISDLAASVVAATYRTAVTTRLKRASDEPLHALPRVDTYYFREPGHFRDLLRSGLDGYLGFRRWGRYLRGTIGRRGAGPLRRA